MTVLMVSFLFIYLSGLPSSQLNSKHDIGNHLVRQQMEKWFEITIKTWLLSYMKAVFHIRSSGYFDMILFLC
ncbi:hypothetical protein Hanom_Chr02g00118731 [Helianthus anomalus]